MQILSINSVGLNVMTFIINKCPFEYIRLLATNAKPCYVSVYGLAKGIKAVLHIYSGRKSISFNAEELILIIAIFI